MVISSVKIYDFEESIKASGYPMQVHIDEAVCDYERAEKLGTTEQGSGHGNFLTGITVSFDIKMTHAMLVQFERYHFAQIVSSQSKMHRILQMNIEDSCHELVDPECFKVVIRLVDAYKKSPSRENFEKLVYSAPIGLELTMRINTNYQQLLTMYFQREDHKLTEWQEFCHWIESLRFMGNLISGIKRKRAETLHIKLANCSTSFQEQFEYVDKEWVEYANAYMDLREVLQASNQNLNDLKPIGENGPKIDHLLDRMRSESVDVMRCILKLNNDHLISDIGSLQRLIYSEDNKNGFKGYYEDPKKQENQKE